MLGAAAVLDCLGVGLGRELGVNIALAAKRIGEDPKLAVRSVRFFGKFLGLYSDYFVFEVAFKKEAAKEAAPAAPAPERVEGEGEGSLGILRSVHIGYCVVWPLLHCSSYACAPLRIACPAAASSSAPEVPVEEPGKGANKFTYLVCSSLGGPLTRLPDVTPAQVRWAAMSGRALLPQQT